MRRPETCGVAIERFVAGYVETPTFRCMSMSDNHYPYRVIFPTNARVVARVGQNTTNSWFAAGRLLQRTIFVCHASSHDERSTPHSFNQSAAGAPGIKHHRAFDLLRPPGNV